MTTQSADKLALKKVGVGWGWVSGLSGRHSLIRATFSGSTLPSFTLCADSTAGHFLLGTRRKVLTRMCTQPQLQGNHQHKGKSGNHKSPTSLLMAGNWPWDLKAYGRSLPLQALTTKCGAGM